MSVYIPNQNERRAMKFRNSNTFKALDALKTYKKITTGVGAAAANAIVPGLGTAVSSVSNQFDAMYSDALLPGYMNDELKKADSEVMWDDTISNLANVSGSLFSAKSNQSARYGGRIKRNNGGPILNITPTAQEATAVITPLVSNINNDYFDWQGNQNLFNNDFNTYLDRTMDLVHGASRQLHNHTGNGRPVKPKSMSYAKGGDINLSDDSFLVQGNPNTTDGNAYTMGSMNLNLDHNEVVHKDFVISDDIINPNSGNSYAKDAAKIERATGKAQKKLELSPFDKEAQNSIDFNNMTIERLKMDQEKLATAAGYRDNPTLNMAKGGDPIIEALQQAYLQDFPKAKLKVSGKLDKDTKQLLNSEWGKIYLKNTQQSYENNSIVDLKRRMQLAQSGYIEKNNNLVKIPNTSKFNDEQRRQLGVPG